jgi:chemotaxis protein methyltransferase WspC
MRTIEELLRQRIGLDAASIGASLIERSVRLRMKSLGLSRTLDYVAHLRESDVEWRQLIESVVVSETWFFRDRQAFEALVQIVLTDWLPRHPLQTLRILSAPCSTGEEPYSIAMALLDAGVPAQRFAIHGVDISERALAGAAAAEYGRNAFRGQELSFRDRHFRPTKAGFVLEPRVLERVQFKRLNLLEEDLPGGSEPYDFVFCRNLLIYFDRATQQRLLRRLRAALAPAGLLFVGPAELPLVQGNGFTQLNLAMAFACRRDDAEVGPAPGAVHAGPPRISARPPGPVAAHQLPPDPVLDAAPAPAHEAPPAQSDLRRARALADSGKFPEAQQICEAHLRTGKPVAEVYYLLGLLADARGEVDAVELYRKAIYLEPDHYESLLQLALLLEKQGDRAGARNYRRRAERLRPEAATA